MNDWLGRFVDKNSSTFTLSAWHARPSVAPAVSIVAGSPVERRHCPALSLLTAVNTCKASSWAGTGSCPTQSAASIMPIFPHPLPLLASPMCRRARGPRGGALARAALDVTLFPLSADITSPLTKSSEKSFSEHQWPSSFIEIPNVPLGFLEFPFLIFFSSRESNVTEDREPSCRC